MIINQRVSNLWQTAAAIQGKSRRAAEQTLMAAGFSEPEAAEIVACHIGRSEFVCDPLCAITGTMIDTLRVTETITAASLRGCENCKHLDGAGLCQFGGC
jgi:hypothetical protein